MIPGEVTSRLHCPHKDLDDLSRQMTSSLNSYDLNRLFTGGSGLKDSAGESMSGATERSSCSCRASIDPARSSTARSSAPP